jgi:hypothetical protein
MGGWEPNCRFNLQVFATEGNEGNEGRRENGACVERGIRTTAFVIFVAFCGNRTAGSHFRSLPQKGTKETKAGGRTGLLCNAGVARRPSLSSLPSVGTGLPVHTSGLCHRRERRKRRPEGERGFCATRESHDRLRCLRCLLWEPNCRFNLQVFATEGNEGNKGRRENGLRRSAKWSRVCSVEWSHRLRRPERSSSFQGVRIPSRERSE